MTTPHPPPNSPAYLAVLAYANRTPVLSSKPSMRAMIKGSRLGQRLKATMTTLPAFCVTHPKGHTWGRCGFCGIMVLCGTCGNNCCNAGYGTLPDGTDCPDCPSAYDFQHEHLAEAETFYDGMAP